MQARADDGAADALPAPVQAAVRSQVPPALAAALVLQSVAYFIAGIRLATLEYVELEFDSGAHRQVIESLQRWNLISTAIPLVCLALAIAGGFELMRRTVGPARRGAKIAAGSLIALLVIALVIEVCYRDTSLFPEVSRLEELWRWMRRASVTGWLMVSVGLLACGWRMRGVRPLAVPLVLATLLAYPYDFYAPAMYRALIDLVGVRYYSLVFGTMFDAGHVALVLLVLARSAPPAEPSEGWRRVARALDRASWGFVCRIGVISLGAMVTLWSTWSASAMPADMMELGRFWLPLGWAAIGLVAVSGVLGAAGLTASGAPRALLYSSAAVMIAELALSTTRMWIVWAGPGIDHAQSMARALPMLLPMLSLLGVALISHGLHRIASLLASPALQQQARSSRNTVILGQTLVLAVPYALANLPATEGVPSTVWTLVVIVTSMAVQASLGRMCWRLAAAIRQRAELPAAKIVAR